MKQNEIEKIIHQKILLEHLTYATQQIELQTKFCIKDINEILTTNNRGDSVKSELLKATRLNLRNKLKNFQDEQLKTVAGIIRNLNNLLKSI